MVSGLPLWLWAACLFLPVMGVVFWIVRRKHIFPYVYVMIFATEYLNPDFLGQFFTIGKVLPIPLLGAYLLNVKGNLGLRSYRLFKPLLILSLYFIVSLLWTPDFLFGVQRGASFILLLISFWFVAHFTQDENGLRHFFGAFILLSVVLSYLSIISFLDKIGSIKLIRTNVFGLNTHYTALLIILGTFLLIICVLIKEYENWKWLPEKLYGYIIVFNLLGFLATATKAGLVIIFCGALALFALRLRQMSRHRWKIIIGGGVILLVIFLVNVRYPFVDNFMHRFSSDYLVLSADQFSGRTFLWEKAWRMFIECPLFGFGLDSYKLMSAINTTPHSDLLRVLAEGGIIGGILWLTVLITTLSMVIDSLRITKHIKSSKLEWYAQSTFIVVGCMFILSQALDMLFNKFLWIVLAINESLWGLCKLKLVALKNLRMLS